MTRKREKMILIWLTVSPGVVFSFPTGPGPGYSGAPGDQTCVVCHAGTGVNAGGGKVTISFGGATTYTPGQTIHVSVAVSDPAQQRWGFEASPRLASDPQHTGAGTLATVDGNTQLTPSSGTIQWIEHTLAGTRLGTTGGVTFDFDWTPPSNAAGDVTFYVAANAANGNNSPTGDHIYTTTAALSAVSGGVIPTIRSQNGVLNGADFSAAVSPGSWIAIFGSNFGSTTRSWTAGDIVNGELPTALDGIGVMVNGKAGAICFTSPNQINAQAPDDVNAGTVDVVITTPGGQSDPVQITLQKEAPALFAFSPQNSRYAAAVASDGTLLGPPGLFGNPATTRPARPGETISLYGNGFGSTTPSVTTGQAFQGAAPLVNNPLVTIGGVSASVAFAGLAATSLYQFNVTVPSGIAAGDQKISITVDGLHTQDNLFLTVQP